MPRLHAVESHIATGKRDVTQEAPAIFEYKSRPVLKLIIRLCIRGNVVFNTENTFTNITLTNKVFLCQLCV